MISQSSPAATQSNQSLFEMITQVVKLMQESIEKADLDLLIPAFQEVLSVTAEASEKNSDKTIQIKLLQLLFSLTKKFENSLTTNKANVTRAYNGYLLCIKLHRAIRETQDIDVVKSMISAHFGLQKCSFILKNDPLIPRATAFFNSPKLTTQKTAEVHLINENRQLTNYFISIDQLEIANQLLSLATSYLRSNNNLKLLSEEYIIIRRR